jgi:FMN-dependent NADH-azoreductase
MLIQDSKTNKRAIALSCSPSRGRNSDTMLDHFIRGVEDVGVSIEKIYIEDIPIDNYRYENGKNPLAHETLFHELAEKLRIYDGLVVATPTYNFSVPAQLKNFVDRIRFIALDLSVRNLLGQPVGKLGHLRTYFLVSGGISKWSERLLFFAFPAFWLRGVFLYYGAQVLGAYYSGDIQTFKNEKILKNCYQKGKKYGHQLIRGNKNRLLERIFFRPAEMD